MEESEKMKEIHYFAYGSNLHKSQQKERVGNWITSEKAFTEGYRRIFNVKSSRWGGYAANLKKTDNISDKVYGVVYLITEEQLNKMTKWEGNEPISILVTTENSQEKKEAKTYVWKIDRSSQQPPEKYKNAIIIGLKEHGYGQEIIKKVQEEFFQ